MAAYTEYAASMVNYEAITNVGERSGNGKPDGSMVLATSWTVCTERDEHAG